MIRTLQYWISFIENCCSRVKATAHLIVIGSWADRVKEVGENVDQKWLDIKKACISSSSSLSFVGFAALNCRKLASSGLGKICDMTLSSTHKLHTVLRNFVPTLKQKAKLLYQLNRAYCLHY